MDSVKSKKAKTPVVQKTPKSAKKNDKSVNKTPLPKNDTPRPPKKQNGVQTPNKKGNATPKKTPKTDPKKKKTPPKKVEDSEGDDDDEEDDSEIELNPELMKKLSEMQDDDDEDMEDDDEEDDDEAEEDDDDDEEDDEESELDEEELKVLIQSLKGKKSKKEASTESAKGGKKTEKPEAKKPAPKEFPKPKQPKEADKTDEPAGQVDKSNYLKSIKERDCRTLFMKGLPIDIKEETLLKLSKDIQSVRIRKRARKDERRTLCYAFIEFVNEAMAEKNFKVLSETKIDGKTIMVDYTGEKSLARPTKERVIKELDPCKLYITGFPYSTTELELKQLMPKAETVTLPIKRAENRPLGFAFAKFADAEVCSQELKRLNGKSFKECTLVVLHANLTRQPKEATKRKSADAKGKAKKIKLDKSKKAKKEEKMEEEEDDDDDDDEEDDDDDDDEEDDDSDEE